MTTLLASVVLCTYNPNVQIFQRTLQALSAQDLPFSSWELIIVDNASDTPVAESGFELPSNSQCVVESKQGLVFARIRGIQHARGEFIVFCDDDTVLDDRYLSTAIDAFNSSSKLGVIVGKSTPEFETAPEPWTTEFHNCLGLWDHGPHRLIAEGTANGYPPFAGGGGGAVFRREALEDFIAKFHAEHMVIAGRSKDNLSSGEDNDIVLSLLSNGWQAAYIPELSMRHLMPQSRLSRNYLARLNEGIARSWVKVLHRHGLSPWRPRPPFWLPLQIARAYVRTRAWMGPAEYVRWRGACGHFRGRADIYRDERRPVANLVRTEPAK